MQQLFRRTCSRASSTPTVTKSHPGFATLRPHTGFTIVELLVVIVVIGILAAISLVSYAGINERAINARIASDLSNNAKLLELYKIEHEEYPQTVDDGTGATNCPQTPAIDNKYCLKVSDDDNTLTYEGDGGTGGGAGDSYTLTITDDDADISYEIVPGGQPVAVDSGGGGSGNVSTILASAWGGDQEDYGFDVVQTSDGGYAVTGETYSFGAGNYDLFMAKYDSSGSLSWDKTLGGTSAESDGSVIQTSDDGYVLVGTTLSFGAGNRDILLVKLTSGGSVSWTKTWGGASYDYGSSLINTSDGGFAVTGYTDNFGAGLSDMLIAKFDSSGGLSWDKTFGGENDELSGYGITQTSDGGYITIGNTYSFSSGAGDMLIARFESNGDISGCPVSMCQNPDAIISSISTTVSDPVAISSDISATNFDPTPSTSNPDAVTTQVVPVVPPPVMTLTFSAQELYVAWPGDSQTVCKEWTVPDGKTIKGFMVSQATEAGYDYFIVSSDGVEKYNKSGSKSDVYVNISASPGTTLSACMSADSSTQDGYGGQVTGVVYD